MHLEVIPELDLFATMEGDECDPDFDEKNIGREKMYSFGPVCHFKGKQIPYMVTSTDSGSIHLSFFSPSWNTWISLSFSPG
jgi:hypothetical protein